MHNLLMAILATHQPQPSNLWVTSFATMSKSSKLTFTCWLDHIPVICCYLVLMGELAVVTLLVDSILLQCPSKAYHFCPEKM